MSDGNGIEYEDFEIEVSPCAHEELEVRVLRSPYFRPRAVFLPPYSEQEGAALMEGVESEVLRSAGRLRDVADETSEVEGGATDLREVGKRLFEGLFTGKVRDALTSSYSALDSQKGLGLRVRLGFGPAELYQADLGALPWELLYHPGKRKFLALDPRTPVVRYLDTEHRAWVPRVPPPLKLLVAMSAPDGTGGLDLAAERKAMEKALHDAPVALEFLEPPVTLERLCERIRTRLPHVVHFMGHGDFQKGEGVLLFEDDAGAASPVSGELLADQLGEGLNFLRLMVLNACEGAKMPIMPRRKGRDPFTGVASELIMAGLPAVLAMQFPISDSAARHFSGAFYQNLGNRRPVDAAVTEGRLAIQRQLRGSMEWATPVLFLRLPDGHLLDFREEVQRDEIRVGILSIVGWGKQIREIGANSEFLLDLTKHFEGRAIRDTALWHSTIGPRLESFLSSAAALEGRVRLEMAAHASIAFTVGYHWEVKSGLTLLIPQRGPRGTEDWHADQGEVPSGELWEVEEQRYDRPGHDVALGIAISRGVEVDVKEYLETSDLPVGRLLLVSLPKVGNKSILGGAHAFELAEQLARLLEKRTPEERKAVLHLFVSGPNAFVFYLGQLARNFGPTQLYEHGFGAPGAGEYSPSLRLGGGN